MIRNPKRKAWRDARNARHKANEERRMERRIDKMFQPLLPALRAANEACQLAVAIETARKRAWESGAFG